MCAVLLLMDVTDLSGQACWMVALEVLPTLVAPSAPLYALQRPNIHFFLKWLPKFRACENRRADGADSFLLTCTNPGL